MRISPAQEGAVPAEVPLNLFYILLLKEKAQEGSCLRKRGSSCPAAHVAGLPEAKSNVVASLANPPLGREKSRQREKVSRQRWQGNVLAPGCS